MSGTLRAGLQSAWQRAFGFAGLHAFNAALSILFILVQTLIFSRVLDATTFAQTIAAAAISMYLSPVNQSVARANFVLLRDRAVREHVDDLPEAAAAFQASQAFYVFVSLLAPFLVGAKTIYEYSWLSCFLVSATFSNIWYSEMQMAMMATDRARRFEIITLIRRILNFVILGYLFVARDVLWFNVLAAIQVIAFHIYLLRDVGTVSRMFGWPRGLTWVAAKAHLRRLWLSLQTTLAEWLTLNAPYAVFMARFGIGSNLVTIDAAMKLVRIIVSVTRNLCEIALPRVSHAVFTREGSKARQAVFALLAIALCAAGTVAAATFFVPDLTFGFLLGPNNTVPPGAGAPIAAGIIAAVGFATSGHLLGHTGRDSSIWIFMATSIAVTLLSSGAIVLGGLSVQASLWCMSGAMMCISAVGFVLLWQMLQDQPEPAGDIRPVEAGRSSR